MTEALIQLRLESLIIRIAIVFPQIDAELRRKYRVRIAIFLTGVLVLLLALGQVIKISNTISRLTVVEAERDAWQKPSDVIAALSVHEGSVVADVGCGAGYFALKLSRAVGSSGEVFAVDIQRLPLAILWIRARLDGRRNVGVRVGNANDPHLPAAGVDAVLIANTYHEFSAPELILDHIGKSLRSGGRLVVLDRFPGEHNHKHGLFPAPVEDQLRSKRYDILDRREQFVNGPDGDRWWLITAALRR